MENKEKRKCGERHSISSKGSDGISDSNSMLKKSVFQQSGGLTLYPRPNTSVVCGGTEDLQKIKEAYICQACVDEISSRK